MFFMTHMAASSSSTLTGTDGMIRMRDQQLPPGLQEKIDRIKDKSTDDVFIAV